MQVAQVPLAIPFQGMNVYVAKVTKFKNNKMLVKLIISCVYINNTKKPRIDRKFT
jgi:hypothetical protein